MEYQIIDKFGKLVALIDTKSDDVILADGYDVKAGTNLPITPEMVRQLLSDEE